MLMSKMRVKRFDVSIIKRIANETSLDGATQSVDEYQVKRREG